MKIYYSYKNERGNLVHGEREVDVRNPETYKGSKDPIHIVNVVAHSGFPPEEWSRVLDKSEADLYESDVVMTYEEMQKYISQIIHNRKQNSIILDSV